MCLHLYSINVSKWKKLYQYITNINFSIMITLLSIDRVHFYYKGEIHIFEVESFNLKDFHRFPNLSLELIIREAIKRKKVTKLQTFGEKARMLPFLEGTYPFH